MTVKKRDKSFNDYLQHFWIFCKSSAKIISVSLLCNFYLGNLNNNLKSFVLKFGFTSGFGCRFTEDVSIQCTRQCLQVFLVNVHHLWMEPNISLTDSQNVTFVHSIQIKCFCFYFKETRKAKTSIFCKTSLTTVPSPCNPQKKKKIYNQTPDALTVHASSNMEH